MTRKAQWLALSLLVIALAVSYYVYQVLAARSQTPELVARFKNQYGTQLSISNLTSAQRSVLLAIEDPTFFRHHGVDLTTPGAGMTTITQGLVKLLYFPEGFHQGGAKIRQTLIAQYALDALVSKDEQLNLFLNISYLGTHNGKPVHGFENAADVYFGKLFGDLSDDEFLSLVAMLIAPTKFVPGCDAHIERMKRIRAYLAGDYVPKSVLDIQYDGKTNGTVAEELLRGFLRLITDANPTI